MMRKPSIATSASLLVLFCLANLASLRAVGQNDTWYLDPPHSAAQFSVRHMGLSNVRGTFTKVGGTVTNPADPGKATVDVTIEASSVDLYATMRSLYRQHREAEINHGKPNIDNLPDF